MGETPLQESSEQTHQLQVHVESQNNQSIVFSVAPSQTAVICLFFSANAIPSSLSREASARVNTCVNATAHSFTSISCLVNQIDGSEYAYFAGYSMASHLQMDFPVVIVHFRSVFKKPYQPRAVADVRDSGKRFTGISPSIL